MPLVLVFLGGGGNANNVEKMTGFTVKAKKEGFIVVYPEGSSGFSGLLQGKLLTWNAGHCCGYAMEEDVDDVGFINRLLDNLMERYPIDPQRIYLTGMSNGGMMTHRLGIELAEKIAAIAPVVGGIFEGDIAPMSPGLSAIIINGMLDNSVPVEGGPLAGRFPGASDGTPLEPSKMQASFWANANGCRYAPEVEDNDIYHGWQYGCPKGIDVEFYLVKDNGHAWPGGKKGSPRADDPSQFFDATDIIWSFFKNKKITGR